MSTQSVLSQVDPAPKAISRWLALGFVAGPVVFNAAWLVLGAVSPGFTIWGVTISPYSPVSAGISGLGLGPTAPFMNAAFVVSGLLVALGAVGVFRSIPDLERRSVRVYTAMFVLAGIGMAIDGLFTLEAMMMHLGGFLLAFASLIVGYFLVGRAMKRLPPWRRLGRLVQLASPLTLILLVLYFATFSPTAEGARMGIAGLTERILVVGALLPLLALGWRAFNSRNNAGVR
jgi:hypothetical membrane protein